MSEPIVAALYVMPRGPYYGLAGVEPWGLPERDAREYAGPWPVVAHPPCERWSSLNNLVLARHPNRAAEFAHGNDGGCFASALAAVRRWGGVLEHPAHTLAWSRFDLPQPGRGAWHRGICGGWAIEVDQAAYGHPARKRTWLYAYGTVALPTLCTPEADHGGRVRVYRRRLMDGSWERGDAGAPTREITHLRAKATPPAFRDLLIGIARMARVPREATA